MVSSFFTLCDRDFVQRSMRGAPGYLFPNTQRYCSKLDQKENNRKGEEISDGWNKLKYYQYQFNNSIFNCLDPSLSFIICRSYI